MQVSIIFFITLLFWLFHVVGITMPAIGMTSLPRPADTIPRDGRQNKKSKWDKVSFKSICILIFLMNCKDINLLTII